MNIHKIGDAMAWPFLLPGKLMCGALGLQKTDYSDLIQMLINSLAWTIIGICAVAIFV